MKRLAVVLVALAAAGACSDRGGGPSPEQLNERRAAYRQACAARELAVSARDDVETLEQVAATSGTDAMAVLERSAAIAALGYARAYERHADLREAAYAYLDSAANYAATRADSARYHDRSNAFTIRTPRGGSVEENVVLSYQEDFVELLGDDDHPCNWDLPF